MSNEQKVALARRAKSDDGLPPVLAALELPRSSWYYHQNHGRTYTEKYAHLKEPLEAIAREHPAYGYRRTTVELREVHGYAVNHKVVQKLHQEWDLPLIRTIKPPKLSGVRQAITVAGDRVNLVAGREEIETFEVAYADFTELLYADGRRKAYLIPIVDHGSKMALGWAVGERAVTELALRAWERAKKTLIGYGVDLQGFVVHHDQDPVFTGYGWTGQLLLEDHVRVSYALNGARDNPEMESFISRFKTENRSLLLDAQRLGDLQSLVRERMAYHNGERRHSTIGYRAPAAYVATLSHGRSITIPMP
jgi:transposase InsO family protein